MPKNVYYLLFIYKMPYDINVICYTPVQCENVACTVHRHSVSYAACLSRPAAERFLGEHTLDIT